MRVIRKCAPPTSLPPCRPTASSLCLTMRRWRWVLLLLQCMLTFALLRLLPLLPRQRTAGCLCAAGTAGGVRSGCRMVPGCRCWWAQAARRARMRLWAARTAGATTRLSTGSIGGPPSRSWSTSRWVLAAVLAAEHRPLAGSKRGSVACPPVLGNLKVGGGHQQVLRSASCARSIAAGPAAGLPRSLACCPRLAPLSPPSRDLHGPFFDASLCRRLRQSPRARSTSSPSSWTVRLCHLLPVGAALSSSLGARRTSPGSPLLAGTAMPHNQCRCAALPPWPTSALLSACHPQASSCMM